MKSWDLTSGAGKMELAMKTVHIADARSEQYCDDAAHEKFRESYLSRIDPNVRIMLEAVKHLAQVFDAADRECGMTYE
jgi:hypothetical protein